MPDCSGIEQNQNKMDGKNKRWRKEDDITLYSAYKEITTKYSIDVKTLSEMSMVDENDEICQELITKSGWKGNALTLTRRIRQILKESKNLSVREVKILRKVYYQQVKAGQVDWDSILKRLPGKDKEFIIQTCLDFPRSTKMMRKSNSLSNMSC